MGGISVDRRAARAFATMLFGSAPSAAFVEVRFKVPDGMGQRFHPVERLDSVVNSVSALASRTDVYLGVLPRARRGGGRVDLVDDGQVVWVDCDAPEAVVALRAFRPLPGMVVESSPGKRHAYWLLDDPVDLDAIEALNRRFALTLGADVRCADAARILRPGGSVSRKRQTPVPVRLLYLTPEQRVSATLLDGILPADPEPTKPPSRSGSSAFRDGDSIASVPPRVYVERLTGQQVDRSGKIHCPLHEDRSPSLHVYEEPGRGWYCFGCGRGGSIYDLAALLSGRSTRGQDFIQLRRELEELVR